MTEQYSLSNSEGGGRVINLVALMMTRVFSLDVGMKIQFAGSCLHILHDKYTPAEVIFDFLGAYMSLKISHVIRVFIPICEELHWYLVIVDFTSRRLIILDSLSCVGKHQQRKRNAIKVVIICSKSVLNDLESLNNLTI
ncbi:hypothetical protein Ahy_B01g056583 [Arachis hypogaea]|uniref:Ubiquitin-like protease family profile domain-containing protein n=1 Tax=Arachis hypogaea TaxID=3818 RepID=A0A445AZA1_ARAHY|nr:hypothetical protein Ahy_B01g056583 [Arachis hypogaea]